MCRETAAGKGWHESAPAYIVPGKSRTRWINLSDAEKAIPQLKQMLDDAEARKFDVLVALEYDRFRDLLEPVANALSDCGVQIYSVSQPVDPQDPEEYNPYNSDSDFLVRGMNQIISKAAIASLRRKYAAQMPLRLINRGLPAQIPYGYRKPKNTDSRNAVPVQDPEVVPFIIRAKDWLLSGHSLTWIAARLQDMGAPYAGTWQGKTTKSWSTATVSSILTNPFYAGTIRWGISRQHRNRRTGNIQRTKTTDPAKMVTAPGRHIPLWDDATHRAIIAEIKRRTPAYRGYKTSALSNLLHCPVCGAVLWKSYRGSRDYRNPRYVVWRCSVGLVKHIKVADSMVFPGVIAALREIIANDKSIQPAQEDHKAKLSELLDQRKRIADGYQAGIFDMEDAAKRTSAIDLDIAAIRDADRSQAEQTAEAAARAEAISRILAVGDNIIPFLMESDPLEVNRLLTTMMESITVSTAGEVISIVPRVS
jgi:hypothetical protein